MGGVDYNKVLFRLGATPRFWLTILLAVGLVFLIDLAFVVRSRDACC